MENKVWFWEKEGERVGPIDESELRQMLEAGAVDAKTLVWCEGMTNWAPAAQTELVAKKASPPGLPPQEASSSPAPANQTPVLVAATPPAEEPIREAKLNPEFRPQIRHSFGRAWELLKTDFWPFVGFFTLVMVLTSVASQLLIPIFFLMLPIMVGFNWYVLKRLRGRDGSIDDLFFGFKRGFSALALINLILYSPIMIFMFIVMFGAFFLAIVATEGGNAPEESIIIGMTIGIVVLSILATLVFSIIYAVANFACLLVLDCGLGCKEAIRLGWQACKPHIGKLIVFYIFASVVSSLGMIALYVGVLVTGAWALMAMTYLYEDAFGENSPGAGS